MTSFFPMLFIIIKSEGLKDAEMGSCAEAFHIYAGEKRELAEEE